MLKVIILKILRYSKKVTLEKGHGRIEKREYILNE